MNQRISARIRLERESRGWSLSELADRAGVSRAMIHKIERGDSSPTATLLARLSGAFGISMSTLIARAEMQEGKLLRLANQPVWRDPQTHYLRRHVSPRTDLPIDLVQVELPAGSDVPMPALLTRWHVSLSGCSPASWCFRRAIRATKCTPETVLSWGRQMTAGSSTKRMKPASIWLYGLTSLARNANAITPIVSQAVMTFVPEGDPDESPVSQNRRWVLASRPQGAPVAENFRLETQPVPPG
jgi:transcriptional regulator with XRE-family HTH domain